MSWFIYCLTAMFIEGILLFIVKLLSFNSNPLVILTFQYLGSLICVAAYTWMRKIDIRLKSKELIKILIGGFLVSTGFSSFYIAISMAPASIVIPLHNISLTIIPSILAVIFLKEKVTKKSLFGILAAIISVALLTV